MNAQNLFNRRAQHIDDKNFVLSERAKLLMEESKTLTVKRATLFIIRTIFEEYHENI